jgi:hypothetical protein
MKHEELRELLASEDYKVTKMFKDNKATKKDINAVEKYNEGDKDFFHDLTVDGKPPKYMEYLKAFLLHVVPWYQKDKGRPIKEGELNAIVGRANNLYVSKMAELSLELLLKEKLPSNVKIIHDRHIDRGMGVDYVLEVDGSKYLYLHVFANTKFGWDKFLAKGSYKGKLYNKYDQLAKYQRTPSKHHIGMAYSKNDMDIIMGLCAGRDPLNSIVGNIPFFEKEALDRVMKYIEEDNLDCNTGIHQSQFAQFKHFCKMNLVELSVFESVNN